MVKLRDINGNAGNSGQSQRFSSLDALRGLLLLLFVCNGFALKQMLPQERWNWLTSQWTHRDWQGCTLWDLLPAGMLFAVGVAMPFSYADRQGRGQSWPRQFLHAVLRTCLLALLGVYLDSYQAKHLVFDPRGDLQTIAFAYLLAFLVLPLGMPVQGVTLVFFLIGHTAAYVVHAVLGGLELWSPAQNIGLALDQWMRVEPHPQHYVTLSLAPATAIVLSGILIGGLARGGLSPGHNVAIMAVISLIGIALGWLLSGGGGWVPLTWRPLVPMIPRLGTLSFVLMAVGWILLIFTYFYTIMQGFEWHAWAFPLTVPGQNPLVLYLAAVLCRNWAAQSALLFLPESRPLIASLRPLLTDVIVLAIFWLLCFFLYFRSILVKV